MILRFELLNRALDPWDLFSDRSKPPSMPSKRLALGFLTLSLFASAMPALARAEESNLWEDIRAPTRSSPEARRSIMRANRALSEQQYAIATREALKALRIAPDSSEAFLALGSAQLYSGHPREAMHSFERAIELDPRQLLDPNVSSRIAHAAIRAGNYPLAIDALHALIAALPSIAMRANAFNRLADLVQSEGRVDEAIILYRNALLEARSMHPRAALGLALALRRLNRNEEAAIYLELAARTPEIERIIQEVPGHPSERSARNALIHLARGEKDKAHALFLKVADESPHHREHALREARQ